MKSRCLSQCHVDSGPSAPIAITFYGVVHSLTYTLSDFLVEVVSEPGLSGRWKMSCFSTVLSSEGHHIIDGSEDWWARVASHWEPPSLSVSGYVTSTIITTANSGDDAHAHLSDPNLQQEHLPWWTKAPSEKRLSQECQDPPNCFDVIGVQTVLSSAGPLGVSDSQASGRWTAPSRPSGQSGQPRTGDLYNPSSC